MPVTLEVKIDPLLRDVQGRFVKATDRTMAEARRGIQKLAKELRDEIRRAAPGRGGLRRFITYRTRQEAGETVAEVRLERPKDPYPPQLWAYIRQGTRAHDIFPVRARALRFEVDGEVVFAKHVRHPGTEPNDFVMETYGRIRGNVEAEGRRLARYAELAFRKG